MHTVIGLFGGTFNPVHRGHIEPVLDVRDFLGLAGVHFVPVNVPSHRDAPGVEAAERLDMLQLALGTESASGLLADDREIRRGGSSYSIDTLAELRALYGPDHSLVLILGLDAFLDLPSWHRFDELLDFAHIAVMERPGSKLPTQLPTWWRDALTDDPATLGNSTCGKIIHVDVNELDISSTAVRGALKSGDSVGNWLHPNVAAFIETNRLYDCGGQVNMTTEAPTDVQSAGAPMTAKTVSATASDSSKAPEKIDSDRISELVVEAMDDAKARDISALDVRDMTDFTDYMIIATGTSDRHLRAVVDNVRTELKSSGVTALGSEGDDGGDWVLIDLGGVIAHVMRKDAREFYDLDGLWSDDVRDLIQAQRDGSLGDGAE